MLADLEQPMVLCDWTEEDLTRINRLGLRLCGSNTESLTTDTMYMERGLNMSSRVIEDLLNGYANQPVLKSLGACIGKSALT